MEIMKYIMVILFTVLLVGIVSAEQIDYQEYTDFSEGSNCTLTTPGAGSCVWHGNSTGGNSYMDITSGIAGQDAYVMSATGLQTTYAAGTLVSTCTAFGASKIMLFDSAKTGGVSWTMNTPGRYEVVSTGSSASLYRNGTLVTSQVIVNNPYYVGFGAYSFSGGASGCGSWDDLVYGSSEDRNVLDMPADAGYYIKLDFVNPASNGFYNATTNAVVSANFMPTSFSRSNLSGISMTNESFYLINAQSGTVYETQYTGTDISGIRNFNIGSSIISAGAPYGWYQTKLNNSLSTTRIAYIANGANINFDMADYSIGDNATITYLVDAAYWQPGTYTYRIEIVDAYGTVHNSQNIAASSGSVSYTWTDADTQGVYFAEIIADRISNGEDILMNYDYATVTATFGFNGYVNAAGNATPISGASVTYSQGDTIDNTTSGIDGNYSVSGFLTGIAVWANVSATGYQTQNFTFAVQNGHTIARNITLNATSPTFTGIAIGGVARDGILNGQTITSGYGRPIAGATCYLQNTTNTEMYSSSTNNAGGYIFDESTPVFLTSGRLYDLWCSRSGYSNSPNYSVVA